MIIKRFRRALFDDFVGRPSWFDGFFDLLNQVADVFTALQNNLTFSDNHRCAVRTVSMVNNTEKTVTSSLTGNISMVLVGRSPAMSAPISWVPAGRGSVKVTASFVGNPTEAQQITLYLFEG